jgi:cholesterol oxidase
MKRISKPLAQIAPHYDAVVVGSGYGGGVAASRLARMGYSVAVLERGEEIHPGEFPDTPAEALAQSQISGDAGHIGKSTGLYDLHVGAEINVLVGCGLGGTSLINANVALEADPRLFNDPVWPAGLQDRDLASGYELARAMLKPRPYPNDGKDWPTVNKLHAMEAAARRLGRPLDLPPLNVSFEAGYNTAGVWQPACNLCGDCCSGCNTGAKSTTLMNYLPDAAAFGAEIFCALRVRSLTARDGGGWNVHYVPQGLGREGFDAEEPIVSADIVVLAAGTLGSTEILLRSRERGLSLSEKLGSRFSGNGDVLAFGYNNDRPIDGIGLGTKSATYDWRTSSERPVGPTIAGLIDLRCTEDVEAGMVIEEGAIPGGIATFMPSVMAATAAALGDDTDSGDYFREKAREVESLVCGPYRGAVNNTQTFLVMSHDGAEGTMRLHEDRLQVNWPGVGDRPGFRKVAENLREAVAATGGTYVPNPIWTEAFKHDLVTVHPLGGCPMGDHAADGVVDGECRVYAGTSGSEVHDGLYVCDGSVMPRSLGVNPLLTISAVAERAMIRLARARQRTIDTTPAAQQAPVDPLRTTVGIRFTEKMGGTVTPAGGGMELPAHFVVTVIAPDAERLLKEKDHEADLVGTLHLPAASPEPLTVSGGRFNLFTVATGQAATKQMEYRMPLTAADGTRYFFFGRKLIHDDPGFDLWKDTTTLFVRIHEGTDDNGRLLYEGTLTIDPRDFVRQLATMTVTDAPNLLTRLNTICKFRLFFAGQLFDTYAGLATGTAAPAPPQGSGTPQSGGRGKAGQPSVPVAAPSGSACSA